MFIRKRKNPSGSISIQIIDKSNGKYKVVETIACVKDKKELAVAAFLYLCKEKPCPKYNELLAMLFMNGILLNDGFSPLWIKERDKTEFKIRYLEFERSHQASDLMHYLVKIFQKDTKRHLKLKRTKDKPKKPLIFF